MIKPASLPQHPKPMLTGSTGFTLIEMAVVLFLVSLVLGGVMTPLATRIEQKEREKTQGLLKEIKESLIGYSLVNGHLPCPDCPGGAASVSCGTGTAAFNDGIEDGSNGAGTGISPRSVVADDFVQCAVEVGNLPWVTLGVNEFDGWGNRFVYSIDQTFADNTPGTGCGTATAGVSFELCSTGDTSIWEEGAAANLVANNVPALVFSYGANGNAFGGTAPTSADELDNWWTDVADRNFVSTDYNQTTANEYDDLFIWISPGALMYKMVTAERLP